MTDFSGAMTDLGTALSAGADTSGNAPATQSPFGSVASDIAAALNPASGQSRDSILPSAPYDATDAAVHGMTFGLSDAARAALMAGSRYVSGATPGFDYSQAAREIQRGREAYTGQAPFTNAAANLAGGLVTGAPAGARMVAGAAGPVSRIARSALTGGAMGAVEGAADNNTSLEDAAKGATRGGEIGLAVGGALPLAGAMLPGPTPAAQGLRAIGVEPTPGNAMGGIPAAIEDLYGRIPVLGVPVQAGRRAAQEQFTHAMEGQSEDFQRGAINQVLGNVGETLSSNTPLGNPAIDEMATKVGHAYDAAVPSAGAPLDLQLAAKLSNIRANLALRAPTRSQQFDDFLNAKVNDKVSGGVLPGQAFKDAEADFGSEANSLKSSSDSDQRALGFAYRDVQGALRDNLERNAPASAADIRAANTAYREMLPVQYAAGGNLNGNFTPMSLGQASRIAGGRTTFARGGAPMQSFAQGAEQDRQNLANLGSSLRAPTGTGGHGGGFGAGVLGAEIFERMMEHPHGPALAAALAYPAIAGAYSNAGRRLVNRGLAGASGLLNYAAPVSPLLAQQAASRGLLSLSSETAP
jgi:hypothetical protein